ncbi:MAG: hypothetical protein P1U89_02965 [Verrucomicrobiales bacterium]|nr:hypothetical protein [Verrucomicrobiales bacterium]
MDSLKRGLLIFGIALGYGLTMWGLFVLVKHDEVFAVVSWTFVFLVPIVIGGLTTFFGIRLFERSTFWIHFAPMIAMASGALIAVLFELEAILCAVVAIPIMTPFAWLGGFLVGQLLKKSDGKLQMSFLVLLPLATGPLESLWEQPHREIEIHNQIAIDSPAATIWKEIASVRPIQREEIPFQWIYLLDFPRPIAAELDRHEVGGKRIATFERDVSFFEIVTEWEEEKRLSFSIEADPDFIPKTAFDQHIIIGGRFYDVLDGNYWIEATEPGKCMLHLSSSHRLSTPFNAYAGWWSEWVMNQIQGSILHVIRNRCEAANQ